MPAPCPGRVRREGPRSPVGETVSGEQDAGWGGQSGLLFHDRLRRALAFCCHASPRTTTSLTSNGSPGEPGEAPRGRGKSTWGSGSGRTRSSCLWGPGRLWGPWSGGDRGFRTGPPSACLSTRGLQGRAGRRPTAHHCPPPGTPSARLGSGARPWLWRCGGHWLPTSRVWAVRPLLKCPLTPERNDSPSRSRGEGLGLGRRELRDLGQVPGRGRRPGWKVTRAALKPCLLEGLMARPPQDGPPTRRPCAPAPPRPSGPAGWGSGTRGGLG